ncbi:MAG: response regulator [Planctomycetota bacterium]
MPHDPQRVLIVDDEAPIAHALQLRLKAAGFEVRAAHCGRDGLDAVDDFEPEAVLLDIRMPDIDGYEVCRHIRRDHEAPPPNVVFLSANSTDAARIQAREAGGDAFLSKPYNPKDVIETLHRLISKQGTARSTETRLN